jgi:hypothetical protein BACCOPRO_00673
VRWEKVKLGDCCEITSSKRIFYSEYAAFGIPFYRSKEIIERSQGKSISEPLYITNQRYDEIKCKFGTPVAGDMLLTSVGTIGIPYIVKATDKFYFKDGNLTWFRRFTNKLYPQYLFYWITSKEGVGVLNNVTIGSSQKALTISALKNIEVTLPPIETQRRIADILSAYDDLIENNRKQIKLLEEAAQRLYKEWFVDLRFPGHEHTRIVDGVPEGWEKRCISDIATINESNIPKNYQFNYIEYIDLSSVQNGIIKEKTRYPLVEAPGRAKRVAKDGDIIWGMVRPNLKSFALVLHPRETDVYSTGLCVLSSKAVPFSYLYYSVTTESFIRYLVNCTNGAAYPAVKPIHFAEAELLFPSKMLLKKFNDIVEPMLRQREKLLTMTNGAMEARDRLLPKLMSGKVEV